MNLPNKLTLGRVIMIPLFVVTFLSESANPWLPFAFFVIATVTDTLDGMLARKMNLVTDFGKLMDPLADKLMVSAALICFTYAHLMHPAVAILIISRELLVTGLRMIASAKGKVIPADFWGKIKTDSQDATIIVMLLWLALGECALKNFLGTAVPYCVWIMTALTVISAVNYCVKNKEIFANK